MNFKKWRLKRKMNVLSKYGKISPSGICLKRYCEAILNGELKEKDRIEAYEKEIDFYAEKLQPIMGETLDSFPEAKRILVCAGIYEVLNTIPEEKILY